VKALGTLWMSWVLVSFHAPLSSGPPAAEAPVRSAMDFMTGGECLFCHRGNIGSAWQNNAHNRTVREAATARGTSEAPAGAEFALGARKARRWLRTTESYGVLAMRTADGRWDDSAFKNSCAGCHASGVDPRTGAFATVSLDCFVCHGDIKLEHANDPGSVHLSPRRADKALVVISICGSCHLRGGLSQSTGRPWPRAFVAGDTLLDDFQFDFSDKALEALSLADRHVAQNVRDVALRGQTGVTCLSCHSIHRGSSRAHRRVRKAELCFTCHIRGERRSRLRALTRSSAVCGTE